MKKFAIAMPIPRLGILTGLALIEFVRNALMLTILPNSALEAVALGPAGVGLAISAHYLFDNLLRTPSGLLIDHFGAPKTLTIGLLVASLGILLIATAQTAPLFVAGAALFGAGAAPLWPSVVGAVTANAVPNGKAVAMGKIYIAWLIGGGAGPVVVNLLYATSYPIIFTLLESLVLIAGFFMLLFHQQFPKPHTTNEASFVSARRYFGEIIVHLKDIRALFPIMFMQTFAMGLLIPVLSPYLRTVLQIGPQLQSVGIIIVGGVTAASLPMAGHLIDRLGFRPFLSGGFLFTALMLALFLIQREFLPALLCMAFVGVSYAAILPAWNTILDRAVDERKRGVMWGLFMTVEGLGTASGPLVSGQLWSQSGIQAPFILSVFVVGLMGVLYLFLRVPALAERKISPKT
ncbi:MFS transporter [Ferroacidibacillus organovorans]|uniref:MFS transporter n=1 Tax=Ferroacidibacillus organovorans TaxID=1765683 RepID=A0A162U6X7_9BACL|nr:MFS transporter [Ferroacidibacillus organovorans]KYP81452.1 hypothetical protein AYJ22_07465 [Ferroacidibacillus organovorans]OAG94004.1 hypothetical protein AYW79_07700 [Ferroacidibacillus organovorans]OPG16733.1 MFS transporter [Ferroacidibacillus organovorans]